MTDVHILAIDLAKRSFQVCATAAGERVWMLPVLQGDFWTVMTAWRFYRSCVRPLGVACYSPRAGMQFEERGHIGSESFMLARRA